jgi:hypothetical protein
MKPLRFVPYHELDGEPNVIVDGSATGGTVLTLSHWPKSPVPAGLERDLSAEMALAYLARGDLHGDALAVSNNHFDQDGLVSVFALSQPSEAAARQEFLVDVAAAGDFATFRNRDAARVSMIIAAFADPERSPLGALGDGSYESRVGALYPEMLRLLPEFCDDPSRWRELWTDEDATLAASEALIDNGTVTIDENDALDLAVIHVPESAPSAGGHRFGGGRWELGLHPMAVCNATERFVVLTVRGPRYEVLYRYETWVQYWTRRPRPRVDLGPLAERLNAGERGGAVWAFEGVDALAPRLYVVNDAATTLSPHEFQAAVEHELATAEPAWIPFT